MATEKRLIDAYACPCIKCDRLEKCRPGICESFAEWWFASVDAVEVVHGRWIEKHNYFQRCYESTDYKCSICGLKRDYLGGANYCPNCGAKMDGDWNG